MKFFKYMRDLMPVFAAALALTCAGCNDTGNKDADASKVSASADSDEKLPSDLPAAVPLYDAELYTVSDSDEGEWGFIYQTPDKKDQVAKTLTDAFSKGGWTIDNTVDLGDKGGQIKASNGQYDVRLLYTPNPTNRDSETPTMMVSYDVETAG